MTNSKHTKRALLASVLSVVVCAAMLVGSTFAWFTDSVTSAGNIIKSGNLKVALEWANGTEALDTATWQDASTGAIFNYNLWEPGYTEARHVRISNKGNLALKYEIRIVANGEVSKLAEAIDVYYVKDGKQLTSRNDLTDTMKIGTLKEVLANPYAAKGHILASENAADVATIALKMQEDAGNEYQGLSIGTDFSVQLVATQYTSEKDSFDDQYDAGAYFPTDEDAAAAGQDAKVNGKYYKDLASAVAAATPQSTVTLIDNTTVASSVKLDTEDVLTIDLNGKTLEAPNGTAINMSNGGELTLVNGTVNSNTYAVYAAQNAVIHELNIDMNAGAWGVYLKDTAVLEKVTGGTYKSNPAGMASFPLYVGSNATIKEISGGDFQGSKAAIANYGRIEKISGGTFHGTYYDGTNATMWEPDYSVMYGGTIGSITGGTFFKGKTNIAQNMTSFDAALTAGGTALTELPETATIMYKKNGSILTEYTGHYYKVQ